MAISRNMATGAAMGKGVGKIETSRSIQP